MSAVHRHDLATLKRSDAVPPNESIVRVLRDDLTLDPENDPKLGNDEVLYLYRHMVMARQLDERLVALQRQGRIGFHVGSLGEEGAILGSALCDAQGTSCSPVTASSARRLMRGLEAAGVRSQHVRQREGHGPRAADAGPQHLPRAWAGVRSARPWARRSPRPSASPGAPRSKKDVATLAYFGDGARAPPDSTAG